MQDHRRAPHRLAEGTETHDTDEPEGNIVTTTDLYETMSTLRAVRKLRPDPIPADVLERVLQAACWDRLPRRRFGERLGVASNRLPERIDSVEALPRNPVGKITKPELRERWT